MLKFGSIEKNWIESTAADLKTKESSLLIMNTICKYRGQNEVAMTWSNSCDIKSLYDKYRGQILY